MIQSLIGAQLIEFDTDHFAVKDSDGHIRNFVFEQDEGGCCGYNDLENTLLISTDDLARNPVITKIERAEDEGDWEEHVIITFFGEDKKLAQIDSCSGSGSGWCYGACVTLKCVQTGEEEYITSW